MNVSKVLLRTAWRDHLLPLAIGLIDNSEYKVVGHISDPDFVDGYYQVAMERTGNHPNMIYTFENGSLNKSEMK